MFELRLLAPEDLVETVSDALEALDALSVSVEDADAQTEAEQALFGEPGMPPPREGWQRSRVLALFATEEAAQQAQQLLAVQDFFAGCALLGLAAVPEQDWVRLTQAQFAPVEITPDFWIVPSWHDLPPQARRSLRLDPGLAFGTGTHPTTRMCLRWMARQAQQATAAGAAQHKAGAVQAVNPFGRVLDYGCGSGILALGAALFGATEIDAVDIDPAAVQATLENARANGVQAPGVQLRAGLPELAQGQYQTVFANILASPLKVLAPLLCAHVAPGGWLVLAGILERQAQELQEAYAPWLRLEVADTEDGWILMAGMR